MAYKVPFVNYPLQYLNLEKEIDAALRDVLKRGDLILRSDVEEFEEKLASFVGTKYAVALNSGTDALIFALKAAGVGQGDEVITVSHTFVASIASIIHVGAKPILIEVKEDFNIDTEKIEEVINQKTKAILPVHLNGRMANMENIMDIAPKYLPLKKEDLVHLKSLSYQNDPVVGYRLSFANPKPGEMNIVISPKGIEYESIIKEGTG